MRDPTKRNLLKDMAISNGVEYTPQSAHLARALKDQIIHWARAHKGRLDPKNPAHIEGCRALASLIDQIEMI